MTNAEKIRAMTDMDIAYAITLAPYCLRQEKCPYMDEDPAPCYLCAFDWLKEEHTDEP